MGNIFKTLDYLEISINVLFRKVLKQALKDVHQLTNPTKNLMIHDEDMKSQLEKRQRQSLLISRRLSHNPDTEVSV